MERLYDAVTTPYDKVSTNTVLFEPILSTIKTIENNIQTGGADAAVSAAVAAAAPAVEAAKNAIEGEGDGPVEKDKDECPQDEEQNEDGNCEKKEEKKPNPSSGNSSGTPSSKSKKDLMSRIGEKKDKAWDSMKENASGECDSGSQIGEMVSTLFKFIFYILVFPLLPWFYITKLSYQKLQQINTGLTQPL
jgi:hypothetical protein